MIRSWRRHGVGAAKTKQQGVAIVEFTLAIGILVLLTLVTAEFGRALFQHNTLTKSVREAARYLSSDIYTGGTAEIDTAAIGAANNLVVCGRTSCGVNSNLDGLTPTAVYADLIGGADDPDGASLSCDDGNFNIPVADHGKYVVVCAEYSYVLMLGSEINSVLSAVLPAQFVLTARSVLRVMDGGPEGGIAPP